MSGSSQNNRPVIFWISTRTGVTDHGNDPVDAPSSCGPCCHGAPPAGTGPATCPRRRPGLFIPYSVLQVLAVLAVGGVTGLLITLKWPQAGTVLGTICAIIGAGLAILDIMRTRDGSGNSGRDRA